MSRGMVKSQIDRSVAATIFGQGEDNRFVVPESLLMGMHMLTAYRRGQEAAYPKYSEAIPSLEVRPEGPGLWLQDGVPRPRREGR